jgi:hypothetical protein
MMTHRCFAHGCARVIPLSRLMCRTHWMQVPVSLQLALLRAWKRVHGSEWSAEKNEGAVLHYCQLRREAREAVRSTEAPLC